MIPHQKLAIALVLGFIVHPAIAAKPSPARAANDGGNVPCRTAVKDGISQILSVLGDRSLDREARSDKIRGIMNDFLDFETFSRLSIGPSWRDWNDTQRSQFVDEFKNHMLGIAAKSTKGYDDEEVVVLSDEPEKNGDCTVHCRVLGKMKDGVQEDVGRLDFRLRPRGDQWKVIDVHVAGISMANTFRAQFLVIMKDGGVDKLLKMLHERNAGGGAKPPRTAEADK